MLLAALALITVGSTYKGKMCMPKLHPSVVRMCIHKGGGCFCTGISIPAFGFGVSFAKTEYVILRNANEPHSKKYYTDTIKPNG